VTNLQKTISRTRPTSVR